MLVGEFNAFCASMNVGVDVMWCFLFQLVGTLPFIKLTFAFNDKTLAEDQGKRTMKLWYLIKCMGRLPVMLHDDN